MNKIEANPDRLEWRRMAEMYMDRAAKSLDPRTREKYAMLAADCLDKIGRHGPTP